MDNTNTMSIDPDPVPPPAPSISELEAQIAHLEADHKAKGFPLSGRIIHLCHHLPVEITRVLPSPENVAEAVEAEEAAEEAAAEADGADKDAAAVEDDAKKSAGLLHGGLVGSSAANSIGNTGGVLSPPRTPEFLEHDSATTLSEHSKWKLSSRRGHTAMISGMRSLSNTHEQVVVAWTGDVMQEYSSSAAVGVGGVHVPVPVRATPEKKPTAGSATGPQDSVPPRSATATPAPRTPVLPVDSQNAVYLPELTPEERKELEEELAKFSDFEAEKEGRGRMTYAPVFVPAEAAKGHYEGYCKTTLWPLFHYLLWLDSPADLPAPDPMWLHYQETNLLFAKRLAEIYKPGDLVIVHDYHLLLVPKMIRECLGQVSSFASTGGEAQPNGSGMQSSVSPEEDPNPNGLAPDPVLTVSADVSIGTAQDGRAPHTADGKPASPNGIGNVGGEAREHGEVAIGMFIHTPWPSSEIFRCLPKRKEILEGMLGANFICFQTYSYSRHFASTCIRVCGYESTMNGIDANGQVTAVGYCPIGVDVDRVMADRDRPDVKPKYEALRSLYKGKKIIVGREKLDVAKGVYNKLQAFDKFLQVYPEWRGKVVLVQVTTPALSESPNLERMVAELVSHINGTYGALDFTPVHHYHQAIDRDEYFGLLSAADLALITSLRDGMNTTSMEFILCQDNTAKAPLVLSEFMGTASSFASALQINPHDLLGVAHAINQGLTMSTEEKEKRHAELLDSVKSHTSHTWARTLVKQLLENVGAEHQAHQTPALDRTTLRNSYRKANKRLLLFDYDGTLTPIVKVPSEAIPTERTRNAIAALCKDPKNVVYLISGRDGDFLEEHWGMVENLGLSAEHGSFVKPPGQANFTNLTELLDMSWMSEVEEIFKYYTERTTGSNIELKKASITWHYRQADPTFAEWQAKEMLNLLESTVVPRRPIEVMVGKKNLEARCLAINKGEIVKKLIYQNAEAEFIFCAGDDKTDEFMYSSIRSVFPPGGLKDPSEVITMEPPAALTLGMDDTDVEELPDVEIKIRPENVFMTSVGPPAKKTLAGWHVTSPEEVVAAMESVLQS